MIKRYKGYSQSHKYDKKHKNNKKKNDKRNANRTQQDAIYKV
jgi:hypothetical protein